MLNTHESEDGGNIGERFLHLCNDRGMGRWAALRTHVYVLVHLHVSCVTDGSSATLAKSFNFILK